MVDDPEEPRPDEYPDADEDEDEEAEGEPIQDTPTGLGDDG